MTIYLEDLKRKLELVIDDASHWEDVCNEIEKIFGAQGVILAPATPSFRGVWMSCSTRLAATLQEYITGGWHLKDPREKVTALMIEQGSPLMIRSMQAARKKRLIRFIKAFCASTILDIYSPFAL